MAQAATEAGATVISQIRYRFGDESPAGCTAIVMLDESHVSIHTYADLGLLALDVFTCGGTDPMEVWRILSSRLDIEASSLRQVARFDTVEVTLS